MRIVQVGMGGFGRDWAAKVLPSVPEVKVVGHVDVAPESLALVIEKGIASESMCYSDISEAIEATSPDALLVTANLPGHVPAVRAGLEAGKHVLVEKPFAPSVEEAHEIIDLAAERGLTVMVSQNYRFFPAVRAVRQLMKSGELGALQAINLDFRRPARKRTVDPRRPPLTDPLLGDMSIHHFDLMRVITGREPREIVCRTWHPDGYGFAGAPSGAAMISFDDDLVVSYRGNWISTAASTAWAGEWSMEFEDGEVWWTSRGDRADGGEADRVIVRPFDGEERELDLEPMARTDRAGSMTEFEAAIRENRTPETVASDNVKSLALTYAAIQAATSGEAVRLD